MKPIPLKVYQNGLKLAVEINLTIAKKKAPFSVALK